MLGQALGIGVRESRPLGGGDICEAFAVDLEDGRQLFVKTCADGPEGMFEAEAFGLRFLGETNTVNVPQVVHACKDFLALELVQPGPRIANFEEQLGQQLAALHRYPTGFPGLERHNYIGSIPQDNSPADSWCEFYARRRLQPLVERAVNSGVAPARWTAKFEKLYEKLPQLLPQEPMSRLHGDLWGGNLHVGPQGRPYLVDPAVYVGHREVDLAMMRLFGGFGPAVFAAYEESYPLAPGAAERVPLYQLYPLLVHVNLFGAGYVGSVERTLKLLS